MYNNDRNVHILCGLHFMLHLSVYQSILFSSIYLFSSNLQLYISMDFTRQTDIAGIKKYTISSIQSYSTFSLTIFQFHPIQNTVLLSSVYHPNWDKILSI